MDGRQRQQFPAKQWFVLSSSLAWTGNTAVVRQVNWTELNWAEPNRTPLNSTCFSSSATNFLLPLFFLSLSPKIWESCCCRFELELELEKEKQNEEFFILSIIFWPKIHPLACCCMLYTTNNRSRATCCCCSLDEEIFSLSLIKCAISALLTRPRASQASRLLYNWINNCAGQQDSDAISKMT